MQTTAQASRELDEVTELIEEHKGAFVPGFARRNQWGGWDYGHKAGQPVVRTTTDDVDLVVYSFRGWIETGHVRFSGNAASAYLVTAVVESYL